MSDLADAATIYAEMRKVFVECETLDELRVKIKTNFDNDRAIMVALEDAGHVFVVGGLSFGGCVTLMQGISSAIERQASMYTMMDNPAGEA